MARPQWEDKSVRGGDKHQIQGAVPRGWAKGEGGQPWTWARSISCTSLFYF